MSRSKVKVNIYLGTYTYINKDTYCGDWKDDKRHGHGTYTYM